MSKTGAKRFYKVASVEPHESGWCVALDGRTLKTPGKTILIAPSRAAAQLIADEWSAQGEQIKPETMPVTRLMNVAVEHTPKRREELAAQYRSYAGTDLTCYRAEAPQDLKAAQGKAWDDLMVWAERHLNAKLKITSGIMAITQDEAALDQYEAYALTKSDVDLTLLVHFTAVFGSALLAAAVVEGHMSAQDALLASRVDELFQIEQWGEDDEAKIRTENIRVETLALSKLITSES